MLGQLLFFTFPPDPEITGLCHQPDRYKSCLQAAVDSTTGSLAPATLVAARAHRYSFAGVFYSSGQRALLWGTEHTIFLLTGKFLNILLISCLQELKLILLLLFFLAVWLLHSKAKWLLKEHHDLQAREKKIVKTNRRKSLPTSPWTGTQRSLLCSLWTMNLILKPSHPR